MQGRDLLADQMSTLARSLQGEQDPDQLAADLVAAALELIPGAEEGSISRIYGRRKVRSLAPSSDLARHIDTLQEELGEGPCLDAAFQQETVRVPDLAAEDRWPRFAARANAAGAASMLTLQLYVEGDNLGALNLYSTRAHAFGDESEHVGLYVASHAAIAFADAQLVQDLRRGLANRDIIGQAKGILMERFGITAEQAFRLLVRVSQQDNRKLRDVAEELTRTRRTPGAPQEP
ncbi:ANTAR domain-containing protein [Auraticoccus sp. F435]|uniref:ANTAR domain-containing protein n=2 Tax=Auraticoccus cholistanensis TaxID=2656650 RepID=A0A6A9V2E6_9ACTN|nr:ANTAR domain-containing protein [Auraticoccus cholistanensis]